jgi:Zn-finger nucleic acid-binding protein
MRCPVDNETLVMADRNGVEIDYCPKCRGVWLDRGELDKIIERAAGPAPMAAPPQPAHPAPQAAPVYHPEPARGFPPQGYGDPRRPRRDDDDDDYRYKKKRRDSFLGDLFDF